MKEFFEKYASTIIVVAYIIFMISLLVLNIGFLAVKDNKIAELEQQVQIQQNMLKNNSCYWSKNDKSETKS